ncbi:DUF6338 family protein [Kineosporia babensis]|uniref:DUF6338 family protein n=1 Tax=Kineosporia babensis TaxID=499548 RepID=A0A9X1NN55_9ACTN|nr:DUF6338 family protein [Kineosporia babensis]MCD5316143.1 DUF6338 family protein [Kineosporia babensis]
MEIPATQFNVAVFLVMVLPGVVHAAVRTRYAGLRGHDRDMSSRILQALLVSTLLDAFYLVVYLLVRGERANAMLVNPRAWAPQHLREIAWGLLILGIVLPAALAFIAYGPLTWVPVSTRRGLRWLRLPGKRRSAYSPTPTAWDFAAPRRGGCWVRIRISESTWVGGWMGANSYLSTYPEPRDIFIEDQHHVNELGEIKEPVANSAGVWVSLPEGAIVEWINP